jgi:hypothetical protein
MIDLVVPTVTGREADLTRCVESYQRHASVDLNVIVIRDEPTVGLAWLEGIDQSSAPYVHLCCDDLEQVSPTWAETCIEITDAGQIPCPVVRRPDGSLESCGGDMNRPDCLVSEMLEDRTEVDFTTVPFGSREQIDAISMTTGHYETDTYFSHKGRQLGWPTVVAHGFEVVHHRSDVGRLGPTHADHRAYEQAMNE